MNIKQINKIKYFGSFAVLAIVVSIVSNIGFTNGSAKAWCDENASFGDSCLEANYDSIKDKRDYSFDEYKALATSCKSGNPSGIDFGSVDEGSCANAAASCIQKSISLDRCTADNMATLAMMNNCNHGKLYSTGSSCDRLKEMNEGAINDEKKKKEDIAVANCALSGNESEKRAQKDKCIAAASNGCSTSGSEYGDNKAYGDYKVSSYTDCMDNNLRKEANTADKCTAAGGVWSENTNPKCGKLSAAQSDCMQKGGDWISPASGNGGTCKNTEASCKAQNKILANGQCVADATAACKAQYPSTTTPANPFATDNNKAARDACIAGATTGNCDAQTDPALKKACEDGATAKNAVYSAQGDAGECGGAKTNLVVCDGSGIEALGNVLKIVLFILTIIIGIVATGGIVYGAILYASAQDNASQVGQAKTIIRDVAIGLILYGFMIAIVNWLVPGGVIGQ